MACRVFQIICILLIQLWLSPLITSNTDESDLVCIPSIMVPRNTVWKVPEGELLKINCTIVSDTHCWGKLNVSWCRIGDKNECRPLNQSNYTTTEWTSTPENKRMAFLIFRNISMQNAGLYRCEIKSPSPTISHAINVTVTDYVPDHVNPDYEVVRQENNTTNSSNPDAGNHKWPLLYIYICSGIGLLLIIVVIVSVIVTRCRGQKRSIKETIHENQITTTPVADPVPPLYKPRESPRIKTQTLPAQLNPPPPSIYDIPPARVMSLRDRSSAGRHPANQGSPRRCHDRDTVQEVEEENPLIYATLNHATVPQRPVRVAHVQIEASEYAAIKVI